MNWVAPQDMPVFSGMMGQAAARVARAGILGAVVLMADAVAGDVARTEAVDELPLVGLEADPTAAGEPARTGAVDTLRLVGLEADPTAAVDFNRDVLPILSDTCFKCHGPDANARKAGLRLDVREQAVQPAKSGAIPVAPGKPESSEMVRRINTADPDDMMPPASSHKLLTGAQKALLERWILEGAPYAPHWAFVPPRRPELPAVRQETWPRNLIDRFIMARLDREGLTPSPEAERTVLVRRLTLDLTGISATPQEARAFADDSSPDAYENLADRLLASARFGERMAWEWLEAARYADTNGYQGDSERTMWPWRDWVVDAFNRNLPYDEFTLWQLAGDLLPAPTPEQRLATGFLRNHMINGEGGRIPEENRIDYLFDQTETVATVWLGATFNCTRCHDHKFDPFTQRDYYSLLAFFNQTSVDGSGGNPQSPPNLAVPTREQTRRLEDTEAKLVSTVRATEAIEATLFPRPAGRPVKESPAAGGLPKEILEHLEVAPRDRDAGRLDKLAAHWKSSNAAYAHGLEDHRLARSERDAAARSIPRVMVMEDDSKPRATFILDRGNYLKPAEGVGMAVPSSLAPAQMVLPANRLGLAQWLVSPTNPLTARVTVNRFWQMFFGVGLVKTSEDFGVQGEKPAHPELLDWLATDFVASGWDVKRLVRLMVTSATYRQSSKVTPSLFERDPENRLLARGPRFRMSSWMIRDAALATSGLLNEQIGGAPVKPYQPPGVWEEATFGTKRYQPDHGAALYRRSLYVFWRRIIGPTMFFDVAGRQTCTVKTPRTNVPLHALLTLNDTTYVEAARALAQHLLNENAKDTAARITAAVESVLARPPTADEQRILSRALERHRKTFAADAAAAGKLLGVGESPRDARLDPVEHAAWTVLCSTLMNLDEALTKQ